MLEKTLPFGGTRIICDMADTKRTAHEPLDGPSASGPNSGRASARNSCAAPREET
jgi:hypothetical protein